MSLPVDTRLAPTAPSPSHLPVNVGRVRRFTGSSLAWATWPQQATVDQIIQARAFDRAVTYKRTDEEGEGSECEETGDDKSGDTVETEGLMEQSRGGSPLEIEITHTVYVTTRIRTIKDNKVPSYIAIALGPSSSSLIRLSKVGDGNILKILDTKIGTVNEVLSIVELNDGSWEMVVLRSYCPTLQAVLGKIFPGSDVDLNYDPTEPTVSEVENFGYEAAKTICKYFFIKRAQLMIKEAWPMAADCYKHFAACIGDQWRAGPRL